MAANHLAQFIQAAACPLPQQRPVGGVFHHLGLAGFRRVRTDAFAVDVDHEGVETKLGQHLGTFLGVFADSAPFREHQDALALAAGIVPDGKPLARMTLVLVVDRSRFLHVPLPRIRAPVSLSLILENAFWRQSSSGCLKLNHRA